MGSQKLSVFKAIVTCASGLVTQASIEINDILTSLYLNKNYKPLLTADKNKIHISQIHIDSLYEVLLRAYTISDVRIVLQESLVKGKSDLVQVCEKIKWSLFLDKSAPVKIKSDSIASEFYHEGAIKESATLFLKSQGYFTSEPQPEGELQAQQQTSQNLFFEILSNKLTVSLSLAGDDVYKRKYKKHLLASAPLREDFAHFCLAHSKTLIQSMDVSASKVDFKSSALVVPFGGSGTFIFEEVINIFKISNQFFNRKFCCEISPLFKEKEKSVLFLTKKTNEFSSLVQCDTQKIIYMDILEEYSEVFAKNFASFKEHVLHVNEEIFHKLNAINVSHKTDNFLKIQAADFIKEHNLHQNQNVFMPLNPPYGLRQQSKMNAQEFYEKITHQLNHFGAALKAFKVFFSGFILCPSEETWSCVINKLHTPHHQTFHFMQGGVHIRVLTFLFCEPLKV